VEIIYLCRARESAAAVARSVEIQSLGWFALDDLPTELGNDQRRLIERALTGGATPFDQ